MINGVTTVRDVRLLRIDNALKITMTPVIFVQLRNISAVRTPLRKFALSAGNVLPLNRKRTLAIGNYIPLLKLLKKAIARARNT